MKDPVEVAIEFIKNLRPDELEKPLVYSWGTKAFVIGEIDENNKVCNKITIHPGQEIPEYWKKKLAGQIFAIGQKDPQNDKTIENFFDSWDKMKEKAN